ncbi:MAG TPA: DUF5320 domain-containing protein [Tissierellaceae bacterium]|nr:DUF5320 domain-containing protein [Tissierellaceae bacterium]
MPRFDMTGPMGTGPFTGKGMGYCAQRAYGGMGYGRGAGYGRALGYGRGVGYGRGMGFRRGPAFGPAYYDMPVGTEKEMLEEDLAYLEDQLAAVKEALAKMDTE